MKIKMAYAEQRKVRILEVVTEEMMADPWKSLQVCAWLCPTRWSHAVYTAVGNTLLMNRLRCLFTKSLIGTAAGMLLLAVASGRVVHFTWSWVCRTDKIRWSMQNRPNIGINKLASTKRFHISSSLLSVNSDSVRLRFGEIRPHRVSY
jgi:hypothetical protein